MNGSITPSTSPLDRGMETVPRAIAGEPGLHKIRHILDLVLPVLERQVNVVTQLVDHVLGGVRVADHSDSLLAQLFDSCLDDVELVPEGALLVFSVETDDRLEHFLVAQTCRFCLQLALHFRNRLLHLAVALFHAVVVSYH